jgi:MFS family permease
MSQTEGREGSPIILLVAAAGSALHPLMVASLNVALPAIGSEFAVDAISLSWVVTAYILASATTLVPLGKIAEMVGRKRIFA